MRAARRTCSWRSRSCLACTWAQKGGWIEKAGLVFLWGMTLGMYGLGVVLILSGIRRQRDHEASKQRRPRRAAPAGSTQAVSITRHD
jgi:hypothetical protein